jgi:hypothetical protein
VVTNADVTPCQVPADSGATCTPTCNTGFIGTISSTCNSGTTWTTTGTCVTPFDPFGDADSDPTFGASFLDQVSAAATLTVVDISSTFADTDADGGLDQATITSIVNAGGAVISADDVTNYCQTVQNELHAAVCVPYETATGRHCRLDTTTCEVTAKKRQGNTNILTVLQASDSIILSPLCFLLMTSFALFLLF